MRGRISDASGILPAELHWSRWVTGTSWAGSGGRAPKLHNHAATFSATCWAKATGGRALRNEGLWCSGAATGSDSALMTGLDAGMATDPRGACRTALRNAVGSAFETQQWNAVGMSATESATSHPPMVFPAVAKSGGSRKYGGPSRFSEQGAVPPSAACLVHTVGNMALNALPHIFRICQRCMPPPWPPGAPWTLQQRNLARTPTRALLIEPCQHWIVTPFINGRHLKSAALRVATNCGNQRPSDVLQRTGRALGRGVLAL